jgi:alpha-tubulin suppressor-like RCC1 family protein
MILDQQEGTIYSCGLNDKGQLGLGDSAPRATFCPVVSTVKFVCVSGGVDSHSVAVAEDGALYGWGW